MAMPRLRLAFVLLGIAFGIAAEWVAFDDGQSPALAGADLAVGSILVACGGVAWGGRPESRVGVLMSLAGFTWFLGTITTPALFVHRGPLVQLQLTYPTGRVHGRLALAVVTAAYVGAAVKPLASNDVLTLALSGAVALTAAGNARQQLRPSGRLPSSQRRRRQETGDQRKGAHAGDRGRRRRRDRLSRSGVVTVRVAFEAAPTEERDRRQLGALGGEGGEGDRDANSGERCQHGQQSPPLHVRQATGAI